MLRRGLSMALLLLTCSCQSGPSAQDKERYAAINAIAMSEQQKCETGLKQKTINTYTSYMNCMNNAEEHLRPIHPYADLLDVKIATRKVLGERLDSRKLSLAEADLEFQKINSAVTAETERRLLASRAVAAQEAEADRAKAQQALIAIAAIGAGAAAGAAVASQPAYQPAPAIAPMQMPVTCNSQRLGNFINTRCF